MIDKIKNANIVKSFRILSGNTRTTVMFEPMSGMPFNIYNFYLSLYMKSQGVSDAQIGYLISIDFIFSTVLSFFAGVITDNLGRKRTTLIFDLIAWPLSVLIYAVSNNFWMFALATVVHSAIRIVSISWNLMIIEDANSKQRTAAFNILNIINISAGVFIPFAGILVDNLGIVKAERIFLIFAATSMAIMIFVRNAFYVETKAGFRKITENRKRILEGKPREGIIGAAISVLRDKPQIILVVIIVMLFNIYLPIGTLTSLYFAPYVTEVLGIGTSGVSILGGVYSVVALLIFIFVNPVINKYNRRLNMLIGLLVQIFSLFMLILIPGNNVIYAIVSIMMFAVGFSVFRPLMDSLLADVTEGDERARIYALMNTVTFILTAVAGAVSGYLYGLNPRFIYILSIVILAVSAAILIIFMRKENMRSEPEVVEVTSDC